MRRRRFLIGGLVVLVLALAVYFGVGYVIYDQMTAVALGCTNSFNAVPQNTPQEFHNKDGFIDVDLDMAPYFMPAYEPVSFPSRQAGITLDGWFVPAQGAAEAAAPTVILVHGRENCKQGPTVLMPGGMLNRAGFNVLFFDLRDHGASTTEDGRFAAGAEEYLDVLGAWDYLTVERSLPPARIGLFGVSLGAASVMNAAGAEPAIPALWVDSSFWDIQLAAADYLAFFNVPAFFTSGGMLMGRLLSGDDITNPSPHTSMETIGSRPVYIVHSQADPLLLVHHAELLAEQLEDQGGDYTLWIVEDTLHARIMFYHLEEYEQRLLAFFTAALGA